MDFRAMFGIYLVHDTASAHSRHRGAAAAAGSTVVCYQSWIREFLRFSRDGRGWRHPRDLGAHDVEAFLNHLALHKRVAASTQNQAICAIVFLYRQVLAEELGPEHLGRFVAERARRPRRVPTVLSAVEVQRVFDVLQVGSVHHMMIQLLYGAGLRLMELHPAGSRRGL